ncbi:alpha-mannosidase [Coprobacter tertius]|uniref:Glycosyl hydrolase-related protein n=1 Tax=Coprobacter tertius TaxID=2944915 RepID=A0ABT1MM09_9BACT|nr:alpha-mannosidase [Coprobacter tertius]MCP9612306.1 glycosyl hydrolase-related protein [Coprobacter tertius]
MKKNLILSLALAVSGTLCAQKEYKAYVVSNAHFDSQWNWDVQTSIDDYVQKTLIQNLWLLDNYPDYLINFEGGVKYQWMKEYYPAEYERVKEYIKKGRWHVTGSTWDATDANMPSPESFFRNILYGQNFYKKEFGVTSKDIFLPDCFGFGYTLPTIAAHAGLIGFSTQKLQWRHKPFHGDSKVPFNIGLWQGIDGSQIMAALNAQGYGHRWNGEEDISYNKELIDLAKNSVNNTAYRYYGTGDTGGSPTIESVVSLEKGIKGDGPVEIIPAGSDQIFEDYYPFDKHPELPVYNGELLMDVHATGCYTSQAAMKRFNRRNEQLGDAAEKASVIADYLGGTAYPTELLEDSWKRFIWHQFHDDLTGTSIPKAYEYSWNDELLSQTRFADIIESATGSVAQALDTRVKGTAVIVYNPIASARKSIAEANITVTSAPKGVKVYNAAGKEVPAQLLGYANGQAQIAFAAETAPVSYSVYDVRFTKNSAKSPFKIEGKHIENSVYAIDLNENGDIASIIDKRFNRQLIKDGKAMRLAYFTNNESFAWPAWEIIKKVMDAEPQEIAGNVKITVEENGPLRATLKIERTHDKSTFVQRIRLTNGASDDRIDIVNDIDWDSSDALLKAEFPMNFANPKATYDLGIGSIQRGNNTDIAYEVYAQQWADLSTTDGSYGVTIMNDCKYGWDKPDDNTLRLTLLHTPKTDRGYKYQDKQDLGHHTFTYSIAGHNGTPLQAEVFEDADIMNNPLITFVSPKHKGALGKEFSFVKTNTPQIALKALKKAEDNDTYIVRLYETQGKNISNAEVIFPSEIISASEMNGAEEKIGNARFEGNKLVFSTTSFKPKTFSVTLKKANVNLPAENTTAVKIPYTASAFTPDAFYRAGRFDKKGNSYAAELIGNSVVYDGISFDIAPVDQKNVIKCKKQVIDLPQDKPYTKLYILASAVNNDTTATFKVDGKEFSFAVPYYSGFFGQWGHTGYTEGYVKEAKPAYIGSHRHTRKGNEAYIFTYMYKLDIDIPAGAKTLELPDDENIAVFAVTVSDNTRDNVKSANEMRALPAFTQK